MRRPPEEQGQRDAGQRNYREHRETIVEGQQQRPVGLEGADEQVEHGRPKIRQGRVAAGLLEQAPEGMSVDATGNVTWDASTAEVGTHKVEILVSDLKGGEARQRFDLSVREEGGDSPPASPDASSGTSGWVRR